MKCVMFILTDNQFLEVPRRDFHFHSMKGPRNSNEIRFIFTEVSTKLASKACAPLNVQKPQSTSTRLGTVFE